MKSAPVAVSEDQSVPSKDVGKIEPNYYCRGWNAKQQKYCRSRAGMGTAHPGEGRCKFHGGQKESGDRRIRTGRYSAIQPERIAALIEHHASNPNPLDVAPELATARALMQDFIERYAENSAALLAWYAGTEPLREEERLALFRCLDELEAVYEGDEDVTTRQREDLGQARSAVAHLAEGRAEKPHQILDLSDAVKHADIISKIIHRVNQHQSQNAISYSRLASFLFEVGRELDAIVADRELLKRINDRILQIRI